MAVDHATEGADVVRIAFETGGFFLNDRGMWNFSEQGSHKLTQLRQVLARAWVVNDRAV
ncbi:hypothetical protein [Streptomyces sp. NPDC057966]